MFTPLANKKNRIEEVDRFNSFIYSDSTSAKQCGLGYDVGTANKYLYNFSTGSVVIQCWPNSDDPRAATSGNNREKYLLFNLTNNNTSARKWWQFYIATAIVTGKH